MLVIYSLYVKDDIKHNELLSFCIHFKFKKINTYIGIYKHRIVRKQYDKHGWFLKICSWNKMKIQNKFNAYRVINLFINILPTFYSTNQTFSTNEIDFRNGDCDLLESYLLYLNNWMNVLIAVYNIEDFYKSYHHM